MILRLEKSRTVRHLAIDSYFLSEFPWVDLEDILKSARRVSDIYTIHNLAKERAEELDLLRGDIAELQKCSKNAIRKDVV